MSAPFDLFLFGSTSELAQHLFTTHKEWFLAHIHHLYVIQRSSECPAVYRDFPHTAIALDCADPQAFRAGVDQIVAAHGSRERDVHVFPTYGKFTWNYAPKSPVFSFSDDGLQINLNSRLQIIDAFRGLGPRVKFHLIGSLFANFPYTGDYSLAMWYVNQLPRNAEYADLNLNIYNIGGCRTRFWRHEDGPKNNPFMHDTLPTDKIFAHGFERGERGVFHFYPSAASRVACFLGARGVRVL